MYKHILVALDGSEMGQKTLAEAVNLAKLCQAQLRIVHVVDQFLMNRDSTFFDTNLVLQEIHEAGEKVLAQARATVEQGNVPVDSKLIELDKPTSSIADMIVAEAKAWQADLIVAGSHGRSGVQRLFLGSVAEGVARSATTPVLIVRGA
jgi:nucleotide-binding universal stress UspA family protein